MAKICTLIAAAGRGTRAGLPYPKTLFPIQGKTILERLTDLLAPFDTPPTIIVSPEGEPFIKQHLSLKNIKSHLVVQSVPRGMGDAVLHFGKSPAYSLADHVLLVWGDIPFLNQETATALVDEHIRSRNDFTFVTRYVRSAYTVVSRGVDGRVTGVLETREHGIREPQEGERDIGLFVFRKSVVMEALREDSPGKLGKVTGEHGFLYIIGHLAARGFRVEAMPIATEMDLVSLNNIEDVSSYL